MSRPGHSVRPRPADEDLETQMNRGRGDLGLSHSTLLAWCQILHNVKFDLSDATIDTTTTSR